MNRREFFTTLFPDPADGEVGLRALPSKAEKFVRIGDWDAAETFIDAYMHENVYFGVAVRRRDSAGSISLKGKHAAVLHALFCDIDFKVTDEHAARAALAGCPNPPDIVVNSGGGLHCYWPLKDAIPADGTAKTWLRRLAKTFRGDLTAAEPARILRVPYTINHKYPKLVVVEQLS